jgi:mannose-1-phosphate guanylyltransferase
MFAVIMAGGSGTRFWPASRKSKPKQFLNITGSGPMVVETCNRLQPITADEEILLVLGEAHLPIAQDLFKGRKVHMVGEPMGRNTAPAMGIGAVYARHLGCEAPVAFLPADHHIGDQQALLEALQAAQELARSGGIVTLGIVPDRPETGYGYIRQGPGHGRFRGLPAYEVREFVEKPDGERARDYLASGEYYWNAGIFVATPETIMRETERHLPHLHQALLRLKDALATPEFATEFRSVYQDLTSMSFDYGIMEKTREPVYVIPCSCGWSDVGSWASLYELREKAHDRDGNLVEGDALLMDCSGSFVSGAAGRAVVCLGLDNCLVVDTPGALLVARMDRSQEIKKVVDTLKRMQREALL